MKVGALLGREDGTWLGCVEGEIKSGLGGGVVAAVTVVGELEGLTVAKTDGIKDGSPDGMEEGINDGPSVAQGPHSPPILNRSWKLPGEVERKLCQIHQCRPASRMWYRGP